MGFVRIQDKNFVIDNQTVVFRGLGVGSWLNMEHFMLGIPTPDKQIRESFNEVFGKDRGADFFEHFIYAFLKEEDFIFLKETGVNVIRVPFNYRLFIDDQDTSQLKEEGFRYFDRLLLLCRKYQIYLLPDLHSVPGGQNPDWHSDNQTGIPEFWLYEVFQEQIADLWGEIAGRYRDEPYILGYDVLNEPFLIPAKKGLLQKFYERVTAAIRKVDQNHIIFLEGDFFAMDFSAIEEIRDEQTTFTFHFYPTVWEADLCDRDYSREKRRQKFEENFLKIICMSEKFKRPLFCGEAGYDIAGNELGFVMEMVEDTLDIFEKYQVSWTLWCYKDARHMGLVHPRQASAWMEFAGEIRQQWGHFREMEMGRDLVNAMERYFIEEASAELKYHLQFRQRALLYSMQKELILKPLLKKWGWERIQSLPKGFYMENCEYYEEYRMLLQRYMINDSK